MTELDRLTKDANPYQLYRVAEVTKIFRVARESGYRWIKEGLLGEPGEGYVIMKQVSGISKYRYRITHRGLMMLAKHFGFKPWDPDEWDELPEREY